MNVEFTNENLLGIHFILQLAQQKMGCAMFPAEKMPVSVAVNMRTIKKSQKIDCRKRSLQASDIIVENVILAQDKPDKAYIEFSISTLKEHPLFCTLDVVELEKIAETVILATTQKDQYIMKEGETGSSFFVIKQGAVQVEVGGQKIKVLKKGECFGEIALMFSSRRTASVKSISDNLQLLIIKSKLFKQVMKLIRDKNTDKTNNLINRVQIFSLLTNKQKYCLLNSLNREHHKKGITLFTKDDASLTFYIIEQGKVSLAFNDPIKKDIILGELDSFGESAFRRNGRREGTAVVEEDLTCLTITEERMKDCLGGTFSSIVYHNIKKWALKSSKLFDQYDNKEIDYIAMQFVSRHVKDGGVIMEVDKPVTGLVICIQGKINEKPVGTIFNDNYYNMNGARLDEALIKNEPGLYAMLSFEKLKEILDNFNTKGSLAVAQRRSSVSLKENQNMLDLNTLYYMMKLGQGQFGLVHLVKDRKSGNLFALKSLDKDKIKKQAMEESAISERDILASLYHPLIVGYYNSYQDRKHIYFLLQYIHGIQMFDAIRQIGLFNKSITRYYLGSLILGVEYLHSRNIIYRDIKPQNSIVSNQGKVFLIDMGTAKMLKSENGFRTDTIIGTPHYMAPEVIQGKGYSFQVDFWSFGALFYQMICGRLPFAEEEDDPFKVYAFVMQNHVTFPNFITDEHAKSLIKKLLCKNVKMRMIGGFSELRNSQYFEGFNWDDLYEGKIMAPYIPRKFRNGAPSNYLQMQGYPLKQYILDKNHKDQKFQIWNSSKIA